ncbi:RNA-binding protein 14a isoform X2 [Denticeps clupeoides]|uniref:RNA-binding protein 14a isoform X2 n=1 Tax=Denticeps clupeoides TaxID=299321 RepID=UPI0010A47684|nr:RNA-binding protein 4B-like isoform X2 [Denticeps clupeoides]
MYEVAGEMEKSSAVKLFVGNLALETTQDDLMTLFAPYGQVVSCSVLRQFAFVHLQGEGAADRAIRELNGREFKGRSLVVEESRARPLNSTRVFVGNLSALCTEEDLYELFQTFGKVLECDKVKAGYAFVHMERKEDALQAIQSLHGTIFKGRPLSVELSKIQPSKPATSSKIPCVTCGKLGHLAGDCPAGKASTEHHQSQAAVLAAAIAAAAGLPLQVQQSVHNSFYNTTSFDPTYTALKSLTSSTSCDGKTVTPAVYGALAGMVYGSVVDQVYDSVGEQADGSADSFAHYNSASSADYSATSAYGADSTAQAVFEAARARFFEQGQQVLAEQQSVTKAADRDRSPVRRSALLPDPVPQPLSAQQRPKRRTLLPTPPGGPEETSVTDGDPITRCYAEYYRQYHHYQNYNPYQPYPQYQPYPYPPPPPIMPMQPGSEMDAQQSYMAPGTASPSVYEPPPPPPPPPTHKEPLLRRPDYPTHHTAEPPYR